MALNKKTLTIASVTTLLILIALVPLFRRSAAHQTEGEGVETSAGETASLEFAPRVETIRPRQEDLLHQITLPASLEAFQKATLYSKVAGYLQWIRVDIGDPVRKGTIIAKIQAPEMLSQVSAAAAEVKNQQAARAHAEAELEQARAEYELKKISYERLQGVLEEEPEMISRQSVDEARAEYQVAGSSIKVVESKLIQVESQIERAAAELDHLKTLMAYSEVKAPFSGIITERFVDPGAFIQLASNSQNVRPLVTVARVDTLRIFLAVPEVAVPYIRRGLLATIAIDALAGRQLKASITRFASVLNPTTRTMKTEIDISNREGLLHPGMYGKVTLTLEEKPGAMTLPSAALHDEGSQRFVFCVVDGLAKRVAVEIGSDDGSTVEITKGLSGDENVVVASRGSLSDGTPVEAVAAGSKGRRK